MSKQFRSAEDEHDYDAMRLLVGSAFVLGQLTITQTVSVTRKIRSLAGEPSWMPRDRIAIMSTHAPLHDNTGRSKILSIDAVANYFKHHYEWPDDWIGASAKPQSAIDLVRSLGLVPNGHHDNLYTAASEIGGSTHDLTLLLGLIQGWRERLAAHFRDQLNIHSL